MDEHEARDLIAALLAESAESAEAHFDQKMRAGLPSRRLLLLWRELRARNGALVSWRVAERDHPGGLDRLTVELVFAQKIVNCQIAFEPSTHQVVGLFFHSTYKPDDSDPDVHEETLSVGPLALPASFELPSARAGTLPAAILVAGSGRNDRDESVGAAKPFRDLAHALAKRGIATLRYDKRTFAHPEWFVDPKHSNVEDEVIVDAVAALHVLRARPEIDRGRLFVIGHSLGALLAPEVAQRGGGVAGLVLLAAPGRPLEQILLEQLEARQPGTDFTKLEQQVQALPTMPPTALLFGLPAEYWRDADRRDEMAIAVALGLPVLLLRGSRDRNVAAVDQERWLSALSGHVPLKSATLPGLDHLFVPATEAVAPSHVAPEAIDAIARFIQRP